MSDKKRALTRVTLGIAVMFGCYWLYACIVKKYFRMEGSISTLIGLVCLYGIGLGLMVWMVKGVPGQKIEKKKISLPMVLLGFLLQFTAIMVMSVIVMILTVLGLNEATVEIEATSPYMLFMLLIFNPILEEFVFRKLFADKLLRHGEWFYVFTSAFCFAIVHGVSLGVPQIVYTFILGLVWAYLYVKTGKLWLVIIMHALSNFFGSVVLQSLMGIAMILGGLYSMCLMMLGAIGASLLAVFHKKVVLDGKNRLFRWEEVGMVFQNPATWLYIGLTLVMMLIK